MNRKAEYEALMEDLENMPLSLEFSLSKALSRKNSLQKRKRFLTSILGSATACMISFILLVNCVPTFAAACDGIPVISSLAEAVRFSPSLSAAVEHDYVQEIGLSQTKNDIVATVEYVIVDRKQVSIFFTLTSESADCLDFHSSIDVPNHEQGWSSSSSSFGLDNGELRRIDINFMEIDVPETLHLCLSVYDSSPNKESDIFVHGEPTEPDYLAEFQFVLNFDPEYTAQGEIVRVDKTFMIDRQTLILSEVEIYPTHLRVNIDDAVENTAWLKGLDLYLENENGERFESSINGITATGDPDGKGYATFWLDSPFFSQGKHLTLYITGAHWLEKDAQQVEVDLQTQTATGLSDSIRFLGAKKISSEWWLSFAAPRGSDGSMYQLFDAKYCDVAGQEYEIMQWSNTFGYREPGSTETIEEESMFTYTFPLENFNGTTVRLEPAFTHSSDHARMPVEIKIR